MNIVEVKNLSFKYNKKGPLILCNLDCFFKEGSVNVLLGLNGSGKTTLIKLIAGLYNSIEGDIYINGNSLKKISIRERSKIISYVAQRSINIDDFLVKDYLLFGNVNKLKFYESPTQKDEEKVNAYSEKFNITKLLDKKLGELSGGERQIVSICCAIIQNTDIVLLDEPTSALDIKNQHMVLSLLKEIAQKDHKTFILSSHNPNHALYLNSNVYLLKDAKIVEKGEAKDIVTVNNLKPIYGKDICCSKNLKYQEISFND